MKRGPASPLEKGSIPVPVDEERACPTHGEGLHVAIPVPVDVSGACPTPGEGLHVGTAQLLSTDVQL